MFEKSLYDLIKGLRNHRGAEEEYIQNSLRECKTEIKSQDMDKKATALLKLIYLEMFGYDMSWASFHVLEVMSSTKYLQKRVGYLGAVQSFRPDTEVLMLATNLLKKDIASSNIPNMSLPLITLPHIITPSLALSLLSDILSRLSHSHVIVRKKGVVCLYRLALVYPEALKLAWPKIKERLMDDDEDSSVITAVINVVCELGWRRPQDFLPLAPRFFDLLVEGGNNWMAIKIIKLFATLTPLEPRLTRKLIRPLINIIQTTSAMSLLYECINGIVQCGILDSDEGLRENDEIASLCAGKLRGMIVTDADPNLKYVALLAFNRIVKSHPTLVSMQQDVIMDCLEDADISIRLQALELATSMVTKDTLQFVVNRLISQLSAPVSRLGDPSSGVEDESGQHLEIRQGDISPYLPSDYRIEVLNRILDICSQHNYLVLSDFEWYIDVLTQLVGLLPPPDIKEYALQNSASQDATGDFEKDVASRIGSEIRNVAVRVKSVRMEAIRAAESLVLALFSMPSYTSNGMLGPLAWVVGEFAEYLLYPGRTLESLIDTSNLKLPARTLSLYLQAIPKVLIHIIDSNRSWDATQKSETSLLIARVIAFLETLAAHPDLDVQERAIEFLEILRLAAEAIRSDIHQTQEMPFLLSSVMPGLFAGLELNPVAASAQRKVPLPEKLVLDQAFNSNLSVLFGDGGEGPLGFKDRDRKPLQDFYFVQEAETMKQTYEAVKPEYQLNTSYQNFAETSPMDDAAVTKRKAERRERNRDDPFYIGSEERSSGASTPFHQVFNASNGAGLDIDSIPIVDLKIGDLGSSNQSPMESEPPRRSHHRSKQYDVAADETIGHGDLLESEFTHRPSQPRPSLLQIDSSGLGKLTTGENSESLSTNHQGPSTAGDDEAEMAKAMKEVEKLRLKMQRASERIHTEGIPAEGMPVKKKKKPKKSTSKQLADDGASLNNDKVSMPVDDNVPQGTSGKKKKKGKSKTVVDSV